MKRTLTAIAAALVTTALCASVAFAHAEFASSTPAPGQTLAASPAAVAITFSEEIKAGTTGSVTDASGATVSTGATLDANVRTKFSIALKPALPNGVYKVNWHSVASDDNGMLDGTFFFGVGVPAPSTSTQDPRAPLALALLAGGLLIGVLSTATLFRTGRAA